MNQTLNSAKEAFHDDLTFCPELYADIINPPLINQLGRLEVALQTLARNSKNPDFKVTQGAKRSKDYHCDLCEDNNIYKVPPNSEVKFTQFSRLTFSDMKDALFLKESVKYQSHVKLMKLVHAEQELFQSFLNSLSSKFSLVKSKIPGPWYQHAEIKFKQTVTKAYGNSGHNFRLFSTHVLNVPVIASSASPSIEMYGQLLAYGSVHKIKLPKLGYQVKTDLIMMHRQSRETRKRPPSHTIENPPRKAPHLSDKSNIHGNGSPQKEATTTNNHQDTRTDTPQSEGGETIVINLSERNVSSNVHVSSKTEIKGSTDSTVGPVLVAKLSDDVDNDSESSELSIDLETVEAGQNDSKTSNDTLIPVDDTVTSTSDVIEKAKLDTISNAPTTDSIPDEVINVLPVNTENDELRTASIESDNLTDAQIAGELVDEMEGVVSEGSKNIQLETVPVDRNPQQLVDEMENVSADTSISNEPEIPPANLSPEQLSEEIETGISDDAANNESEIESEVAHSPEQLSVDSVAVSSDNTRNDDLETATDTFEQLSDKISASAVQNTDGVVAYTSCSDNVVEDKGNSGDTLKSSNAEGNCETASSVVHKHVKVAISHDLDVFITDVPFNNLSGNNQGDLTHDDVQEFLLGLKVAECIADIDSLCHIFSVSPPHFVESFLFRIQVVVQEDKSKYFKLSEPLPHGKVTAESLKQSFLTEMLTNSCRCIDVGNEGDANIAFMQYMDDCGAQLIDKSDSNVDAKTQLQDFVEPLKFTSYLPWKNLNSQSLGSTMYSMLSVLDTNVIVHSKQPYIVHFEDSFEKATILVKPQYCYEYGLEEITDSEYAALYLKTLLLDCIGAIVFHVDMKTYNIIHIDKFYLEELTELFPRAEAINRLTSFFELLHTLREGTHVYSHEVNQAHGVLYEELQSEHIQADLILNKDVSMELCKFVSPVKLSRTKLTSWQRHNVRLPMCFQPRKNGTYLCHEYLSRESCQKMSSCAFAHLTKKQLEIELGPEEYAKFMENFDKPKEDKHVNSADANKNPHFGKNLHKKKSRRGSRRGRGRGGQRGVVRKTL